MACGRLMFWVAVPDRSVLEIKIEGSDNNFQVSGFLSEDDDPHRELEHQDLVPQFRQDPLRTPIAYGMGITVTFLGTEETTVDFTGTVFKRLLDGSLVPYGQPRCYTTTGSDGSTDVVAVTLFTKQS